MIRAINIYCVTPSNNQNQTCGNGCHRCENLKFYASNSSQYFTNDTTLEFLPGEHTLPGLNVSVANVVNLNLTGESSGCTSEKPRIMCSGEAGFIFQDILNLALACLTFTHCGQPVPPTLYSLEYGMAKAALAFGTVENMLLQSVTIFNTSGYGILTANIYGKSTIRDCNLQYNRGGVEYKGGNAHFNYSYCPVQYSESGIELTVNDSYFAFGGYDGYYNDSKSTGIFATGIGLTISCTNITVLMNNVTLEGNENDHALGFGGNMFVHFWNDSGYISNMVLISGSRFMSGNAWIGGGLGVTLYIGGSHSRADMEYAGVSDPASECENTLTLTDSVLNDNRASTGSGLYLEYLQELSSNNCTANIYIRNTDLSHNVVTTKKNRMYITNVGVAVNILDGKLSGISITNPNTFNVKLDNVTVEHNAQFIPDYQRLASGSAALFIENFRGYLEIRDSHFQHNNVTAISAFHSQVTFAGDTTILNNTGVRGGGLIVCESTYIILKPNTSISFVGNHAELSGGGIYAEQQCANSAPLCFYQIDIGDIRNGCGNFNNMSKLVEDCGIRVNMINNTAHFSGSHIYGGSIGSCYLQYVTHVLKRDEFDAIFNLEGPSTDMSTISSDPRMVCFCVSETDVNCSQEIMFYPREVYPGEVIAIDMLIAGQLDGAVPGLLRVNTSTSTKDYNYSLHDTGRTCTPIQFTAHSCDYSNTVYEFGVIFHSSSYSSNFTIGQKKYLHIEFKHCPNGYELDEVECKCDCHKKWDKIQCDFEKMILTRSSPAWLGIVDGHIVYQGECPYDYCKEGAVELKIVNGTFDADEQCSSNRAGVLCGKCKHGFSLSSASSACIDCTDHPSVYLAVYIIGKLLFGIGLVFLLTLCNLTITSGTISGLLFYANIFQMNNYVFVPYRFNVLTIILSWVNLDFQLMQCLYNGLDSCVKSWLEFAFPVYLWALVAAIVLLSRRFSLMSTLFAGNTVKILATLIELSYAGLAQAVVTALSPVWITVNSNNQTTDSIMWLYDGNVRYLELKHVPIFLVGAVFGLLILAHTLILLFVQPLQRHSNLCCLSWVSKLKPLIDAYTSPHLIKDQCRYWPGLLLLVRLLLVLVFALNTTGKVDVKLTAVVTSCLLVFTVAWSVGGVYKKTHLNILNSSFIINLGVLSLLTIQYKQVTIAYVSASLAVVTMFGVLAYHVLQRIKSLYKSWRSKRVRFSRSSLDVNKEELETSELLPQLRDSN